jgi:magnesium chelatase subunit I
MEAVYAEGGVVLYDECNAVDYASTLNDIKPLEDLIVRYQPNVEAADQLFLKEFVLWALAEYQKLGKERLTDGFKFNDLF